MTNPDENCHASGVTPLIDFHLLSAIAARHGLAIPRVLPRPWTDATSRVYPCGDVVIKIPFHEPTAVHALVTDARICWCQIQTRLHTVRGVPDGATLTEQIRHHPGHVRRFVDARD